MGEAESLEHWELDTSGAEEEAEASEPKAEASVERARRPRAVRGLPSVEIGPFGGVAASCTAWGMKRITLSGTWEDCSHGSDGVLRYEWPLAELTKDEVMRRWGAGTYRTQWFRPTPGGGRRFLGQGQPVTFTASPAAAAQASGEPAPEVLPPALDPLSQALQVMDLIDRRADSKIDGMAKLAAALAGAGRSDLSGETLRAILRDEREAQAKATSAAIAAAVEPLQKAIADLTEDEDEGAGLEDAAKAAAPLLKGKGGLVGALNFAASNPEMVKAAAPIVAGAFSALAELMKASQVASKAAVVVAPVVERPRAQVAAVPRLHGEQPNGTPGHSPESPPPEVAAAWSSLPLADAKPASEPSPAS